MKRLIIGLFVMFIASSMWGLPQLKQFYNDDQKANGNIYVYGDSEYRFVQASKNIYEGDGLFVYPTGTNWTASPVYTNQYINAIGIAPIPVGKWGYVKISGMGYFNYSTYANGADPIVPGYMLVGGMFTNATLAEGHRGIVHQVPFYIGNIITAAQALQLSNGINVTNTLTNYYSKAYVLADKTTNIVSNDIYMIGTSGIIGITKVLYSSLSNGTKIYALGNCTNSFPILGRGTSIYVDGKLYSDNTFVLATNWVVSATYYSASNVTVFQMHGGGGAVPTTPLTKGMSLMWTTVKVKGYIER